MAEGQLVVCATPIGNLGDVSDRLRDTLGRADVVYAEDTRRAAKLLGHLGLSPPVRSLFVGNEPSRAGEVVEAVARGALVALISEAGTPVVSDPGAEVVRRTLEAGLAVSVVPGPSAVTSALAIAGFGADRFVFEGFLPKKGSERERRLRGIAGDDRPVVLFVSPHRFQADLEALVAVAGRDRGVVVARELTKLHEEVWAGSLGDAIDHWSDREVKGEITVVLEPGSTPAVGEAEAIRQARQEVDRGASPSTAAREVAAATGVSRRAIYEALIAGQDPS